LRSQLAPGYALRKLAPQPTRTRSNYPEEWQFTEHYGLDSFLAGILHDFSEIRPIVCKTIAQQKTSPLGRLFLF
jgi:hypothetical protein